MSLMTGREMYSVGAPLATAVLTSQFAYFPSRARGISAWAAVYGFRTDFEDVATLVRVSAFPFGAHYL